MVFSNALTEWYNAKNGTNYTCAYTTDGTTPTSAIGMSLAIGATVLLAGGQMATFKAISATGTLDVEYFS
jgi:hypothetical protein